MSELGVFAVDRGIFDHPMLDAGEPFTKREAWLWLLAEASWKPRPYNIAGTVVQLKRGQLAHSVRYMAAAWHWPKSNVARFLARLKSGTMIGTEDGTAATVITICKYDAYQRVSLPNGTVDGTLVGTEVGQQRDRKEDIQDIQYIPLPPTGAKTASKKRDAGFNDLSDPVFADFDANVWAKRWPRDNNRPLEAFRAYSKLTEVERAACRAGIGRCARAIIADSSEAKFRPMLATWINKRGWQADIGANPNADAKPVDWAACVAYFKRENEWPVGWGPRPGDPGCKVPPELLIEPVASAPPEMNAPARNTHVDASSGTGSNLARSGF